MAKPKRPEEAVEALAEKFLALYDELDRTECPRCGRHCLSLEAVSQSGVLIRCEGFDPASDNEECPARVFALVTPRSRLPKTEHPTLVT